ncbi:MAG: ribosome maturation factor RimM [Burkholderiaceae bacterium]
MTAELVELGSLRGAYGVRGWVRVVPHQDGAVLLATRHWWLMQADAPVALKLEGVRQHGGPHGGQLVAKWAGCETKENADALRGRMVAVARSEFPSLPAGEFYWVDLIGASVFDRGGELLGQVIGLRDNGAHDLIEVQGKDGEFMIPLVPAYVDSVDAQARRVTVDWSADW